jgi:putative endonuclease
MVYHAYIMASASGVLYTGMTNHLERRTAQHQSQRTPGFATHYRTAKLVYFEPFNTARSAIAREKQWKSWRRQKKVHLIESLNPTWQDLSTHFPKSLT